jgi:hypothetical protein
MFSSKKKNPAAPKESKTVAADVEKDFMHRWIDKRTADLIGRQGPAGRPSAQAVAEYKVTYAYTASASQAK